MKKAKRVLALIGAILLICLYGSTLVLALIDSPASANLFRAAVAATVFIPVLIYAYTLTARVLKGRGADPDSHPEMDPDKIPPEKHGKDSDI